MIARSSAYGFMRDFTDSRCCRTDPVAVIRVMILAVTERGSMVDKQRIHENRLVETIV